MTVYIDTIVGTVNGQFGWDVNLNAIAGVQGATGPTGSTGPTGKNGVDGTGANYWLLTATTGPTGYILSPDPTLLPGASGAKVQALTFNTLSDYRIKQNVTVLNDSYCIDNLNPVEYYNTMSHNKDIGFLAHEVQEFYPFLVEGNKDDIHYQSLNYSSLIPILVKEIKELKKENKLMNEKINNIVNINMHKPI